MLGPLLRAQGLYLWDRDKRIPRTNLIMPISTSIIKNQILAIIQADSQVDTTILDTLDRVERLRNQGYSLRAVAADLGVSYHRARVLAEAAS